jgi:hypothetical protein
VLVIATQPSASVQSGIAFPQQPAIQLRDTGGNDVSQSGVAVSAGLASGGGTLGGTTTVTTDGSGVAAFSNLEITGFVGSRTLRFTSGVLLPVTSNTVTVTPGDPDRLAITTQPSPTVQSGVAFPQQPVVQLRDSGGNLVSQAGVDVTASIGSGAGTLGGTLTVATDGSGVATFTNLVITGTVGDRTLDFVATGLTGTTSNTVTVTAGDADQLSITTQPSASVQSGIAFPQQPVVQVQDASGNDVTQAGVDVNVAIASGAGTLGGTLTATTNTSGVATFTNLVITGDPGDRTLEFTATGLSSVTSSTVAVTSGLLPDPIPIPESDSPSLGVPPRPTRPR